MKYNEVDKNLIVNRKVERTDVEWLDVREAPFEIYGLYDAKNSEKAFHRLPDGVAEATSPGVTDLNYNTAGGTVRFSTDSPFIAIHVLTKEPLHHWSHMPLTVSQGFDLYKEAEDGTDTFVGTFIPPVVSCAEGEKVVFEGILQAQSGAPDVLRDAPVNYTINFPLYGTVETLFVGVKTGSKLGAGRQYRNEEPVVYYGSSITQGGCASRPGASYQARLSAKYNLKYTNLGFSGSAKGERAIVEYMAGLPMSMFVCDYDHNAPNAAHLDATLYPLYEAVRAAHPDLPFLFVSAYHGTNPEWGAPRAAAIRRAYEKALAAGDKNVYYLDGKEWFAGEMEAECTVDGSHPTDLGFFRMFKAFEPYIVRGLGL